MFIPDHLSAKFHTKYEKLASGCWEWRGTLFNHGYGRFYVNSKSYLAHVISYTLAFGEIEKGLCVCHKCDNKVCVNPEHFFLGTLQDNIKDRNTKGRTARPLGEKNVKAKLTAESVREIRKLRATYGTSTKELAERYNVAMCTIQRIINNSRWAHL